MFFYLPCHQKWILPGYLMAESTLKTNQLTRGHLRFSWPPSTWWDPIFALAASPRKFTFMAKEELFKIQSYVLSLKHANAFPVNQSKSRPPAIKTPVKALRSKDLSLIMFPTGSRYSSELKRWRSGLPDGAGSINLSPLLIKALKFSAALKRKKDYDSFRRTNSSRPKLKLNDENLTMIGDQMQAAFDQIGITTSILILNMRLTITIITKRRAPTMKTLSLTCVFLVPLFFPNTDPRILQPYCMLLVAWLTLHHDLHLEQPTLLRRISGFVILRKPSSSVQIYL